MAEPLAVSLHAVHQGRGMVGKMVLVTGCGPIGILTILAARRAGAERIMATDLSDFTLQKAADAGADVLCNIASKPETLSHFSGGKGYVNVQFECSGAASALYGGMALLRPGGTVVQLGLGGDVTIPMQNITAKEITMRG
jgi:L-idonate 5-dehydrogenase